MKIGHLLNTKTFLVVLATAATVSNAASAGDIGWSTSTISPVNESTIRAYGLKYAPTPEASYNVDFIFDENTRHFVPDMSTLKKIDPTNYDAADMVRGGLLYDSWWKINGESEPTDNHAWYPEIGGQTGSTTSRCKECHGWDYKGDEGAYQDGSSHYSSISGLYQVKNQSMAYIYGAVANHNLPLSESDIWDLTKFLKDGMVDMNKHIIFSGSQKKWAIGDAENGRTLYEGTGGCENCHGADGNKIAAVSVGAISNDNPWETLHKIRFGNPGTKMPAMINKGLSVQEQLDILTYAQTLPPIEVEED
jgi:thiosulfate dehydrogenase